MGGANGAKGRALFHTAVTTVLLLLVLYSGMERGGPGDRSVGVMTVQVKERTDWDRIQAERAHVLLKSKAPRPAKARDGQRLSRKAPNVPRAR